MTRYMRIVFEVEVEDYEDDQIGLDRLEDHMGSFLQSRWGIDDIETHSNPYLNEGYDNVSSGSLLP